MKFLALIIMFFGLVSFTDKPPKTKNVDNEIIWLTWEEAVEANKKEKKKIFVDVYTDWCGWCKVMDRKTFADPGVVQYMNEHFYPVKLDAEQKETIVWGDREFKWVATGRKGIHTLAYSMLDGSMSYPSFVLLTENFERIKILKGFQQVNQLMPELEFAAQEKYKKGQSGS